MDRPLRKLEKLGAITIYSAFAVFNYRITMSLRDLMERCAAELSLRQRSNTDVVVEYFSDLSNSGHFAKVASTISVLHAFALAIVMSAVLLDGAWKRRDG